MVFEFLNEVGTDISWSVFAAQCWNLALIYVAWDIVKWFDSKIEKCIKRMRSE